MLSRCRSQHSPARSRTGRVFFVQHAAAHCSNPARSRSNAGRWLCLKFMRQKRVCVLDRRCKYRPVTVMKGQSCYAFSEKIAEEGSELWLQSACSLQCFLTAGVRSVLSSDLYQQAIRRNHWLADWFVTQSDPFSMA